MTGKTYFIADTHFGDEAIIRYENRPFKTATDQEEFIVKEWNQMIHPEDTVYVLGDFGMSHSKEEVTRLCGVLNGKKILVMGNHDTNTPEWYRQCGFAEASPWPIIYKDFWILSHEPMYVNENMPYANIFGHVHSNPIYKGCSRQSFCVCVERTGYRPVSFNDVQDNVSEEYCDNFKGDARNTSGRDNQKQKTFGEKILELLNSTGMSQRELANKADITEVSLSRYIKGTRVPNAYTAQKIANALNVSSDYLLN